MNLTRCLFFTIFSITCWFASVIVADDLVGVVMLYRHGDKAITQTFPKDPYGDISYWPNGFGELLNKGKTRHYYLGQFFRVRYETYLSENYTKSDIRVQSSNVDRCLMSAAAHLGGMFRLEEQNEWLSGLPWEPIPIHTEPEEEDNVLAPDPPCPKFDKLFEDQKKSKFYTDLLTENAVLFKYLSEKTGWNIDDVQYIQTLYSTMYLYSEHNENYIPDWYKSLNLTHIQYLAGLSLARHTFTPELKRLVAGPLINLLLNYFDQIAAKKDTPKLLMLSAHDGTLAAILNAMQHFDLIPPEFAATVIWEMYRSGTGYYINMVYKKSYWPGLEQFTLKGCDDNCDYTTYKKILGALSIDKSDWKKECNTEF